MVCVPATSAKVLFVNTGHTVRTLSKIEIGDLYWSLHGYLNPVKRSLMRTGHLKEVY